tara:strand:+ start:646 stop:1455 length:810 start_codon:yes stop_codon:yes gene_type:complete
MANVSAVLIGGESATEDDIRATDTPPETRSHIPLPHGEFLDMVHGTLDRHNWEVTSQRFTLEKGKLNVGGQDIVYQSANMFGVLKINRPDVATGEDYSLAVGIRNSHDKSMSAGMVAGLVVMVCTNLDFMGTFSTRHKHSVNVRRTLPLRLDELAGQVDVAHTDHRALVESYKRTQLPDTVTHDLLVRLADVGAFPWAYAPKILKEYRNPRHEEFESRTMWAFNNATTEILKDRNIRDLPGSMSRFHMLGKELVTERGSWVDPNQYSLN